MDGKSPASVLIINVKKVFFQCSRAILRSQLWHSALHVERASLPSVGKILEVLSNAEIDEATYDSELPGRLRDTLY